MHNAINVQRPYKPWLVGKSLHFLPNKIKWKLSKHREHTHRHTHMHLHALHTPPPTHTHTQIATNPTELGLFLICLYKQWNCFGCMSNEAKEQQAQRQSEEERGRQGEYVRERETACTTVSYYSNNSAEKSKRSWCSTMIWIAIVFYVCLWLRKKRSLSGVQKVEKEVERRVEGEADRVLRVKKAQTE